jgi:hypothetical protein
MAKSNPPKRRLPSAAVAMIALAAGLGIAAAGHKDPMPAWNTAPIIDASGSRAGQGSVDEDHLIP